MGAGKAPTLAAVKRPLMEPLEIRDFDSDGFGLNEPAPQPASPAPALEPAAPAEPAQPALVVEPAAPAAPAIVEPVAPVAPAPVVDAPLVITVDVTPPAAPAAPVVAAPTAPVVNPFADPFVEKFNEYVKAGGDPRQWLTTQLTDFDNPEAVSNEQLVREKLKRDYPGATAAQLNTAFNREYALDPDQYDADDVTMAQLKLQRDAQVERAAKKQEQQKLALPPGRQPVDTSAEEAIAKSAWQQTVAPVLAAIKDLTLNIGGAEVKVPLTNRGFESAVQAPETLYTRWQDANGNTNTTAFARDLAILDNLPQLLAEAVAAGKRAVLTTGTNATPTGGEPVAAIPGGSTQSDEEALVSSWREARIARGR